MKIQPNAMFKFHKAAKTFEIIQKVALIKIICD